MQDTTLDQKGKDKRTKSWQDEARKEAGKQIDTQFDKQVQVGGVDRMVGKRSEGGTKQSFIRGGSAPRPNPLPFHIPFWQKRYPFY